MPRSFHILACAALSASVLGCNTAPSKPALMANTAKDDVTVSQLRAINYEYAAAFAQLVSACAIEIVQNTKDEAVRDRAYQWRMWASPQARGAAFDQDPFAGLLGLWVLAGQQHQYFAEGGGKNHFGDQQRCVLETTSYLDDEAERLAWTVLPRERAEKMTENVHLWVRKHPIEGELFVRPTARADLAGLVSGEQQGGLKAVGSIEETFRDLNDRLTILSVQMPVEARWQAEYLTQSLFEERVREPAHSMVDAMQDIDGFLDEFEPILAAQTATLLAGFEKERLAVFDSVAEERSTILDAVGEERSTIMNDLDSRMSTVTSNLDEVGRGLIDHFFARLIEVLAAVGVVTMLTVLLVLLVLRRRRSSDD